MRRLRLAIQHSALTEDTVDSITDRPLEGRPETWRPPSKNLFELIVFPTDPRTVFLARRDHAFRQSQFLFRPLFIDDSQQYFCRRSLPLQVHHSSDNRVMASSDVQADRQQGNSTITIWIEVVDFLVKTHHTKRKRFSLPLQHSRFTIINLLRTQKQFSTKSRGNQEERKK